VNADLADLFNGLFECGAGFAAYLNCWRLFQDKEVKGIAVGSIVFFTLWGAYNLFFYPAKDLWWSFYGGLVVFSGNVLWIVLLIYYSRRKTGLPLHTPLTADWPRK
jgi:uncharacterized membrane protein YfcA